MSVWVGSPSSRYTDEFRHLIYEINPNYLPCVYKEMFENNATNNLRELDCDEDDADPIKRGVPSVNRNKSTQSCSSAVMADFEQNSNNKQNDFGGWEICSQAHSGTSIHCSTSSEDSLTQRSRSASISARRQKTPKSEITSAQPTPKREKAKPQKDRRPGGGKGTSGNDSAGKSNDQQKTGQSNNIAGYISIPPPSPIKYPFLHFEYPENYIELYRQEHTLKKLDEHSSKVSIKSCICGRMSGTQIPSVPIMPNFYRTDHSIAIPDSVKVRVAKSVTTDTTLKLRVTNSFHTDTKTIKARHEAAKKKNTSAKFSQETDPAKVQRGRISPHFLLANNGVLKMEFYTSHLTIDNVRGPSGSNTSNVSRSGPSIPYNTNGHFHPTSATSQYHGVNRK